MSRKAAPGRTRLVTPFLLACTLACATTEGDPYAPPQFGSEFERPEDSIIRGPGAQTTPDGLVRTQAPESSGLVFIKPPRPHLQRFSRMMLGNIEIAYKQGGPRWDRQREIMLRESLREGMRKELVGRDIWELTDEPGDEVLMVRVSVLDIDVNPDRGGSVGSSTSFVAGGGGAVLVLEVLSSVDPEPLVRIIQRRGLHPGIYSGGNIDYARLKRSFREFAQSAGLTLHAIYEGQKHFERLDRARGQG